MADYDASSGAGLLRLTVVQASPNIAANQTTVNWSMALYCGNGISYNSTPVTWAVSINGSYYTGSYTFDFRAYTGILIASGSTVINHNSDGTKTISVAGYSDNTGASAIGGPISNGGSLGLTTIPRATQVSVVPTSGPTGSSFSIKHNPASSAFYHDVAYSSDYGSSYINIATNVPGTTTATSWTPAHSLISGAGSNTFVIRLNTRASSGGTIIGTTYVYLPLTVPSSVIPTISSVSWADAQTGAPDLPTLMGGAGRFVQRWSRLIPTVTSAGAGGSTITSSKVTQNGQQTNSGTAFGSPIALSGSVPFTATVTDSRGRNNAPYAGTVDVTAYNFPNLPTPLVTRTSDAGGTTPSPTGTYLAITPAASVSSLLFSGSQKNLLEWQIRIKPSGGSYTTVQAWTAATVSGTTWTTKYVAAGPYAASQEWVVEVSIRDVFGKNGYNTGQTVVKKEVLAPSEFVFMDWDGNSGIGLGGYRRYGMLDVHGDAHATAFFQNGNPVVDTQNPVGRYISRNGAFRLNSRNWASSTSLASNQFFLDGWRSGSASNAVTATGDDIAGRVLTLPANKTIKQCYERSSMPAGNYTVSWVGTATARIWKNGDTAPSYAASPISFTTDGSADVILEITGGASASATVSKVQVEAGVYPTAFYWKTINEDILQCSRFYARQTYSTAAQQFAPGFCPNTTVFNALFQFTVPMRAVPTGEFSASSTFSVRTGGTIDATSIALSSGSTPYVGVLDVGGSGFTAGHGGALRVRTGTAYVGFDAELVL